MRVCLSHWYNFQLLYGIHPFYPWGIRASRRQVGQAAGYRKDTSAADIVITGLDARRETNGKIQKTPFLPPVGCQPRPLLGNIKEFGIVI